jgi:RimJ/RimL family protein N-acetyltransferase
MIDFGHGVQLDTIDKAVKARIWRNDERYNQFFRQVGLITEIDQEDWLLKVQTNPTIKMYAVMESIFSCIGVCGLTSIDWINRKAELSCYTEGWKEKNEIAAINTIVDHGFRDLGLHRIWTETFETHGLHLKILPEIGFQREGTLRQVYFKQGKWLDSIIHALIN